MITLKPNSKILIVRLSALGDCIHTLPVASALKKQYPDIFIGWAVSEKCKDIIIDNPCVDKVHIIQKKNFKEYWKEIFNIREEKYDIVIDSQELLKSATISFLSGAKTRLAHAKSREFADIFATQKLDAIPIFDTSRHVIERNMDFVRFLGINEKDISFPFPALNKDEQDFIEKYKIKLDTQKPVVVIAPTTTWFTKTWLKESWTEIAKNLSDKTNIVFTGTKADKNYIDDIINQTKCPNILNLTGETNILTLKEVFSCADVVIVLDSGAMHLAAATMHPVIIGLFGSTSGIRNGAFGKCNINISINLSCQPCYKKVCKFEEGIPICMKQITVRKVLDEVNKIIE